MVDNAIVATDGLLNSILAEAGDTRQDFGQSNEFLVSRTVEVVQSKGSRHDVSNVYKIYVGPKTVSEGIYAKEISFILIDTLYDSIPEGKWIKNRGARQMWAYKNESGKWERDLESGGPACSSANGFQPRPEHLGKELTDIRTGEVHKIGFDYFDGTWIADSQTGVINGEQHISVCGKCPLGQWRTDEATGKRQPPPCSDAWGYVVYVLPHAEDAKVEDENRITEGFLAIIRGQNSGVQLALPGARAGTPAARQDGAALMGIVDPFRQNPQTKNITVTRRVGEVGNAQLHNIIGFCSDMEQNNFVVARMRNIDGSINEVFTKLRNESEKFPFVVMSVPTYKYAPKGLPEDAGVDAPVMRVNMRVVKNGYKLGSAPNPTLVPEIYITDSRLSLPEYTEYIKARNLYKNTGQRSILMRFDLLSVVDEALQTGVMPEVPQTETSVENLEV